MAPMAIHSNPKDSLNAKAESFQPTGNLATDSYHSASSAHAIAAESAYAAHNYHPLPVVFSRAQGVDVWDPEGVFSKPRPISGQQLTVPRKALPRFPLGLQCRQPRSLPPKARRSSRPASIETHPQLARILQRCLPTLRREGHVDAGLRDGHAHEHGR